MHHKNRETLISLLSLLLINLDHLKPFKMSTFKNWFCTHMVIPFEQCWYQAVLPFKSIQMVLEGPLIHHLHVEVSKQGFVLAVLPFGKIQTRFCKSWPTIQNHLGESTLYTVISPFKTTIANGFKWCINLYEKGTKSRRVKWEWILRAPMNRFQLESLLHPFFTWKGYHVRQNNFFLGSRVISGLPAKPTCI